MAKKIRVGIELNHVIRNINKQIAKYYQKEYDAPIDLDTLDYTTDILKDVCKFKSTKQRIEFMYENYPLEIFGHATEMRKMLSRDLNLFLKSLENYEDYDIELFFYSMKEYDITIQSTYFFLSKIGSRIRKVVFPKSINELEECGDIFFTASGEVIKNLSNKKAKILINLPLNDSCKNYADLIYPGFDYFLKDKNKIDNIVSLYKEKICNSNQNWLSTWMQSVRSFLQKKIGKLTPRLKKQQA